jgi:hypothetical protein
VANPEGTRLLAWSGLQYTGPAGDPDHTQRAQSGQGPRPAEHAERGEGQRLLADGLHELRALQESGQLPAEVDPACLLVMLMAAAMATTTLPHVIEGVCGADPRSPELIEHFADQMAVLARLIGLEPAGSTAGSKIMP